VSSSLTIPSGWLRGIQDILATVDTSGKAYAAIWAAKAFADDAASAVKAGGSWWNPDPWRTSAARDLEEAGVQISREEGSYREGSATGIDIGRWSQVAGKISNVYALAQLAKKAFPEDEDTTGFDGSLISGAAQIVQDILDAPSAATYVVGKATDEATKIVEKVGDTAKAAVRKVGEVAKEAAGQARDVAEEAIPWKLILGAAGVLALVVGGLVVLARSGAIKQVGGIVHG
jgi:hypothetical protein